MSDDQLGLRLDLHSLLSEHPRHTSIAQTRWNEMIELAADHQVAGFLYRQLSSPASEFEIPEETLHRLRESYLLNQACYFEFAALAIPIFETLDKRRLPHFVYKGISLIERVYDDPGARQAIDLDLVVRPANLKEVSDILREAGFAAWDEPARHFYRGKFCIDLHVDLFRLDRIPARAFTVKTPMERLWNRLGRWPFHETHISLLHPYDEFAMLSWHALKHSFSHLKWIVDLKLLYEKLVPEPDFAQYICQLPDDSIRTSVWYTLRLLRGWFDVPVSSALIDHVAAGPTWLPERQAFDLLLSGRDVHYLGELCFLRMIEGIKPRMSFVRDMLFCEAGRPMESSEGPWNAWKAVVSRAGEISPLLCRQMYLLSRGR